MIGAIVLTLRSRPGLRRQRISEQLYRPKDEAVTLVKVPTREACDDIGLDHYLFVAAVLFTWASWHFPQPQELIVILNVRRADAARGEHQPRRLLVFQGNIVARSSPCWC